MKHHPLNTRLQADFLASFSHFEGGSNIKIQQSFFWFCPVLRCWIIQNQTSGVSDDQWERSTLALVYTADQAQRAIKDEQIYAQFMDMNSEEVSS